MTTASISTAYSRLLPGLPNDRATTYYRRSSAQGPSARMERLFIFSARNLVSAIDSEGRTIWIADAHRNGKRLVVRADDKLTAFVELKSATCGHGRFS
jgi:hypothetical protein